MGPASWMAHNMVCSKNSAGSPALPIRSRNSDGRTLHSSDSLVLDGIRSTSRAKNWLYLTFVWNDQFLHRGFLAIRGRTFLGNSSRAFLVCTSRCFLRSLFPTIVLCILPTTVVPSFVGPTKLGVPSISPRLRRIPSFIIDGRCSFFCLQLWLNSRKSRGRSYIYERL